MNLSAESKRVLRTWTRDLVLSLVISFVVITCLYQPVKVEGTSMMPWLADKDRLFINKIAYHVGDIHRDDVVVFHYPGDPSKSYIKRVIAEPGDTISIDHGTIYLNGHRLKEDYLPRQFRDSRSMDEIKIPPDEFFVMGDHRSISSDSRDFGPVPRHDIYGKAIYVYWPFQDAGWIR
jgi:signal peptidase I